MQHNFIPFHQKELTKEDQLINSEEFYKLMDERRSIREFSDEPIAKEVIDNIIKTASTAPSGAHKQPWSFCVVSNPEIKKQIRIAAEKEEKENYERRMSDRWKDDLEIFRTNWKKPFIEIAPYIIVVFKKPYDIVDGKKHNNYYVNESVGIASGILIAAIHNAGLVTLTHTPSPMSFLTKILKRPENERPYLLLPVGFPKKGTVVPDIQRKKLSEIMDCYE